MSKELEEYLLHFAKEPVILYGVDEESDTFKKALAQAVKTDTPITEESYDNNPLLKNTEEGVKEYNIFKKKK